MILLVLSFIAGILTVLAPCTLPLLPVIVGSSVSGESSSGGSGMRKAFIIAGSLSVSIILFTYVLKVSTLFINIPQEVWAIVSGGIILIFGLISLFPTLWEKIPLVAKMNLGSNRLLATGYKKKSFWGDVIIGASLGPVFSTCSPTYFVILATVLPQSLILGSIDLLAYAVGLSGSLLLIAFLGQKIVNRLGGLSDTHGWFKRTLGVIFIILGIIIMFGYDKVIEQDILSSGFFDVTTVEQRLLQFNTSGAGAHGDITAGYGTSSDSSAYGTSTNGTSTGPGGSSTSKMITMTQGPVAPEIVDPSGFINTDGKPITIGQFKGNKVVLLDVWTYSCINCQRTIPYVEAWYQKYKDAGLEVIGLHTPEFAFEKVQSNVEAAVKKDDIQYPVVMDNDYATWNAYGNQYWPRKYLIGGNGEIVYNHIGEGNYQETELAIQKALQELKQETGSNVTIPTGFVDPANAVAVTGNIGSEETYFGAERNVFLANGSQSMTGSQTLTLPNESSMDQSALYLGGTWNFSTDHATNVGPAKIIYKYSAKNVYMVASSDNANGADITVYVDGVKQNTQNIKADQLYTLVSGTDYGDHTLEIDIPASGLNAYTFTFG